ncbi:MAG: ABC transporter permease [Bacteroidales bacterium]|nr:ABC transporter permease [Bacteroidales bacterium]
MFKNYIVVAIRNLFRNKLFSVINILGLAIGMAATMLITEYIIHELSYDNFHEQGDQIYRVVIQQEKGGNIDYSSIITSAVGVSIVQDFPEAVSMVRFSNPHDAYFSFNDKNYYESDITYADSTLFDILSFELLAGDPNSCLAEPRSVVLTEKVAKKIFADADPIGEIIGYNGEEHLKVTGVIADPPPNSTIQFDAIISFSTLYQMDNAYLGWDGGWNYTAFILLAKGSSPMDMQERFEDFMEKYINYKYRQHGFVLSLILQPLNEVHLYSGKDYGLEGKGRLTNLFVFSSIAIFILLIACFNFMNLSTARSVKRAKEVGIRKVSGASRNTIIRQFLGESVFLSLLALVFALILVELFQPLFNTVTGRQLHLFDQSGVIVLSIFLLMVIFTGVLAGSYPAFFMSRFQVIRVIKGNFVQQKGKPVFRNILVVIQFLISAFLIFSTLVIQSQIRFLQDKPLGFEKENIFVIPLTTDRARKGYKAFKSKIVGIPGVISCGASTGIPGRGLTKNGYMPEGLAEPIMIHVMDVDDDYLNIMEIPVIQGEGFSKESGMDTVNILINETLAKHLGWENPIGKSISRGIEMKVIGLIQDYHFASLNEDIRPLLITQIPWNGFYNLSVRLHETDTRKTMEMIQKEWDSMFPDESFEYFSLESYIEEAYRGVSGLRQIFIYFAFLAIIVACLGLLGLASYSTGQKSKEVGIRKVFGADNHSITIKLAVDFLKWVLLANIIAFPFAWWAMEVWLQNFAYSVDISILAILMTLLITLGLSLLTVIFQAFQLANSNPADVLKHE